MGSGKTTVGVALGEEMKRTFIDLDIFIEERYHDTLRNIFERVGESVFREIERDMLYEVSQLDDVIVACGGGTPCYYDNMEYMNNCGLTIYLEVGIECLFARLSLPKAKQSRPLLAKKSDEELLKFIKSALTERMPYYTRANIRFDTTHLTNTQETRDTAFAMSLTIKRYLNKKLF